MTELFAIKKEPVKLKTSAHWGSDKSNMVVSVESIKQLTYAYECIHFLRIQFLVEKKCKITPSMFATKLELQNLTSGLNEFTLRRRKKVKLHSLQRKSQSTPKM